MAPSYPSHTAAPALKPQADRRLCTDPPAPLHHSSEPQPHVLVVLVCCDTKQATNGRGEHLFGCGRRRTGPARWTGYLHLVQHSSRLPIVRDLCCLRGASGFVQKALDVRTGQEVAIKFIHRWQGSLSFDPHHLTRELLNHRLAGRHPNIVQLLEVRFHFQNVFTLKLCGAHNLFGAGRRRPQALSVRLHCSSCPPQPARSTCASLSMR